MTSCTPIGAAAGGLWKAASRSASRRVCSASSRDGESTRARIGRAAGEALREAGPVAAAADRDLDADADADVAGRVEMRWSVGIRKPSVLPLPVLARTRKSREPSSNFGKYDACGADMNS